MPHLLILLVTSCALLTSCMHEENEPAPSPYAPGQRLTSSAGQRISILNDQGTVGIKVRARRHKRKVYDKALNPIGNVRLSTTTVDKVKVSTVEVIPLDPKAPRREIVIKGTPNRVEVAPHYVLQTQEKHWVIQSLPDHKVIAILDVPLRNRKKERTISMSTSLRDKSPTIGRVKGQAMEIERNGKRLFHGYRNHFYIDEALLLAHPDASKHPMSWVALATTWRALRHHYAP